eukprot:scaffold148_cov78-Phaeocystis_antarctica.AAC.17
MHNLRRGAWLEAHMPAASRHFQRHPRRVARHHASLATCAGHRGRVVGIRILEGVLERVDTSSAHGSLRHAAQLLPTLKQRSRLLQCNGLSTPELEHAARVDAVHELWQ